MWNSDGRTLDWTIFSSSSEGLRSSGVPLPVGLMLFPPICKSNNGTNRKYHLVILDPSEFVSVHQTDLFRFVKPLNDLLNIFVHEWWSDLSFSYIFKVRIRMVHAPHVKTFTHETSLQLRQWWYKISDRRERGSDASQRAQIAASSSSDEYREKS